MPPKKTTNGAKQLQGFVKEQVEDVQKRLGAFENEAQKVLENLIARGRESRKEVETLLTRFNGIDRLQDGIEQLRDLTSLDSASVKKLGKRATAATTEVKKRLDVIQARVVETVGVASQQQVKEINRELVKLSKKLDALSGKKAGKAEARN